MLMPLTFISVLWPSTSSSSFMYGFPLNNDFFFRDRFPALSGFFIPPSIALPPTTTTLSTTTTSSHLTGSNYTSYLLHNLNFDDTYDYDEYELEENYVDYEDDEDIGPLQPDDQIDEDESEKQVDTSTENTTLERVSQNITPQSDQTEYLTASYWIYDYDQQNETHFPNYPNDLTYNDTYWDNLQTDGEYNQTDWEGNYTNWEDTTPQNLSDWEEENNQTAGTKSQLNYTQFRQDHEKVNGQRLSASQSGFDAFQIANSTKHRLSDVWQGAGFGVTQGAGTIMRQGQGSSVRQGAGTNVRQGTGFSVNQSAGTNVRQSQGFAVSQGAGEAVHQGVEFSVSQGPGSNVRQDQGFVVNQGAREAVSQEQANDTFVNKSQVKSKMGGITGRIQVKEKTKVSKCCPLKQGYDVKKKRCIDVSDLFNPLVWNGFYFETVNVSQEFRFRIGKVICHHQNEEFMQATNISRVLYVRWTGELTVESPSHRIPFRNYHPNKYCMDNFIDGNRTVFDAFICYVKPKNYTHSTLSCVCMLLTCFLILLRVILFAWLPELRTLHGMILMAYLISFLIGFMLLAIIQIMYEFDAILQEACTGISFVIYFSILSAFFWRNIMCYDIWWTFSCKRAFSSRGRNASTRTRFNLYSAYAFGAPMALTVLLGAFEFSTIPHIHPLMPNLRLQGCFLYGYSKLLYLYGPIIVLFIINIIFSTLTAVKISAIKKETKNVLQSNESSTHDQQKATRRFSLYLKLFVATAFLEFNWILEVIAVFAPDITRLLHISDIYNVLAPLVIFINFMCQKQTWRMMKMRYYQMKGLPITFMPKSVTQTTQTQSQDETDSQVKQI